MPSNYKIEQWIDDLLNNPFAKEVVIDWVREAIMQSHAEGFISGLEAAREIVKNDIYDEESDAEIMSANLACRDIIKAIDQKINEAKEGK